MLEHVSRMRFPLMALGIFALLAGLWGGLTRLGWPLPFSALALPWAHGPLMVCGFLGTVIGVERALAVGYRWPYAVPLLTALGGVALVTGLPASPLITLGSAGLLAVFMIIVRRQPTMATVTMACGTLLWLAGNGLWLAGWPFSLIGPWWSGFLVLTIVGERLELSRLLRLTRTAHLLYLLVVSLFLAGLICSSVVVAGGVRLSGVGMLGLAWWLLRYDLARRTIRQTGLTRFIAVCLLSGYVWLGIGGGLSWYFGGVSAGSYYDARLHAVFVGFVFSMIFGHAPIIFPIIVGQTAAYRPIFYAPLLILHLSLLGRIVGDLAGWVVGRQWGGLLNAAAIFLFLALVMCLVGQTRYTSASRAAL